MQADVMASCQLRWRPLPLGLTRRTCLITLSKAGVGRGDRQQQRSASRTQRVRNTNTGSSYGGSYGNAAAQQAPRYADMLVEVDCGSVHCPQSKIIPQRIWNHASFVMWPWRCGDLLYMEQAMNRAPPRTALRNHFCKLSHAA